MFISIKLTVRENNFQIVSEKISKCVCMKAISKIKLLRKTKNKSMKKLTTQIQMKRQQELFIQGKKCNAKAQIKQKAQSMMRKFIILNENVKVYNLYRQSSDSCGFIWLRLF